MNATLTVGKRLIPIEQIALVESFDPNTQLPLPTERTFHARVVLLSRESVLTEDALSTFTEKHGFRQLGEDAICTNPAIHFSVEAFVPTPGFVPTKEYRSRLMWRDFDGEKQSKLLLSAPEVVLACTIRGEKPMDESSSPQTRTIRRSRKKGIAVTSAPNGPA